MASVSVVAKIVEDNTGVASEIPLLLTEDGVLSPLTDHLFITGLRKLVGEVDSDV